MRLGPILAALAAAAWVPAFATASAAPSSRSPAQDGAAAKPLRIMSLNMCTDLLLLQLVPKRRIASVTQLAREGVWAVQPRLDAGVPLNHGAAEDIALERPDLILSGDVSTPTVRKLARQLGAPLIEVKSAESFEDIRVVTRQVGKAVGEPERAEALLRRMDATLAELAATRPKRAPVVAAWTGDSVPGRRSLFNAIIEAAGAVNVAAKLPGDNYSTYGLEELLAARPDALLYGGGDSRAPSKRLDMVQHPVLLKLYRNRRLMFPDPLYNCGLPQSAEAARALRQALAGLPQGPAPP